MKFITKYGKQYETKEHFVASRNEFHKTLKFIRDYNSNPNRTATLDINYYSDIDFTISRGQNLNYDEGLVKTNYQTSLGFVIDPALIKDHSIRCSNQAKNMG